MKSKTLTLIATGIVGLVLTGLNSLAVNYNHNDWPSTLTFKNNTVPTPSQNASGYANPSSNPNIGGDWLRRDDWSGGGVVAYTKTLPDNTVLWMDIRTGPGSWDPDNVNVQLSYYGGEENWDEFWTLGFSGPSLDSLQLGRVEPNFSQPEEGVFRDWAASTFATLGFDSLIAGGISEDGSTFLAGGDPNSPNESNGGGAVIVNQAQELNIGLEFNNGQWVPAQ